MRRGASSDLNDLHKALESYHKAQDLVPKTEFTRAEADEFLCQIHMNLGITHTDLKDNQKALYFLKKSLDYARRHADPTLEADAYRNMAACFELSDMEKALKVWVVLSLLDLSEAWSSMPPSYLVQLTWKEHHLRAQLGDLEGEARTLMDIGKEIKKQSLHICIYHFHVGLRSRKAWKRDDALKAYRQAAGDYL